MSSSSSANSSSGTGKKSRFFFRPSLPGSIKKITRPKSSPFARKKGEVPAEANPPKKSGGGSMIKPIGIPEVDKGNQHKAPGATSAQGATSVLDMASSMGQVRMSPQSSSKNRAAGEAPRKATVHWSNKFLRVGVQDCGAPPRVKADLRGSVQGRKYEQVLIAANVDSNALQQMAWNGIPDVARAVVWQLLLGYLPSNNARREATLQRKRDEYRASVRQYWEIDDSRRTEYEQKLLRQIMVDIPRTHPDVPLFHTPAVQRGLERVLYIWSIKHPASGYVQGMNDLATPFYLVFLGAFVDNPRACDISRVPPGVLSAVEADTYWCLTKLLDGIQDHYTPSQPGIQRMIHRMEELVKRIDHDLFAHLEKENLIFMQFAFRWMNCLLMRELSLNSTVRLWDTYLAESRNGFDDFHVYVCTSFLVSWSSALKKKPFQELITFLQSLPTQNWVDRDIEMLVSQAFVLQTQFQSSKAHLR